MDPRFLHGMIGDVLEMTAELEAPQPYWFWSALASISAVSKNFYLDRFAYKLYPNIYVLLVGKSANRKGPPVSLASSIVEECSYTRVVSGMNTIQSVIEVVAKAKTLENGNMITDGSCFLISDEQSNIISDDPQAQTLLTQLYDTGYHKKFEKSTVSGGSIKIKQPYFVMLGATAPSHLPEYIQSRSVTGGYIGRTMIVNADKRALLNSLMEKPKVGLDPGKLVKRLKEIIALSKKPEDGQFLISDEGKKIYDEWYYPYNNNIEAGTVVDDTGTSGRLGDHVLKIAMLLALSYKNELLLSGEDITLAIETCTQSTTSARKIMLPGQNSKDGIGLKMAIVMQELIGVGEKGLSRTKLLQRRYGDIDYQDLDRVIETLSQGNIIDIEREDGQMIYKLSPEKLAYYRGKLEEKKRKK
jgi:DNA-binding transcriptional ArsR family regulator